MLGGKYLFGNEIQNNSAKELKMKSRLKMFTIILLCLAMSAGIASAVGYVHIGSWGSAGSQNGQFNGPGGIAVDSQGNVYVGESFRGEAYEDQRIQKFSSSGQFRNKWSVGGQIWSLAIGQNDTIFASTMDNRKIKKYSSDGKFIREWQAAEGRSPMKISVNKATGLVYVGAYIGSDEKIQKYSKNGDFISQFGSMGQGDGQFYETQVSIVALRATQDVVFTGDEMGARIQKFTANGNFMKKWASPPGANLIAGDTNGNIYLFNVNDKVLTKTDYKGNLVGEYGLQGFDSMDLKGLAVNGDGTKVYLIDGDNSKVHIYNWQ